MSIEGFIKSLPKKGWKLDRGGQIRCEVSKHPTCPIVKALGGRGSGFDDDVVKDKLGLTNKQTDLIIDAADNPSWISPTGKKYRRVMLNHFGLVEKENV